MLIMLALEQQSVRKRIESPAFVFGPGLLVDIGIFIAIDVLHPVLDVADREKRETESGPESGEDPFPQLFAAVVERGVMRPRVVAQPV